MILLAVKVAYTLSMLIQGTIAVRLVLMLTKANMANKIASLIVKYSDMFVTPLSGITNSALKINDVEVPAILLVALVIYVIISIVCSEIIKTLSRRD